MQFPRLALFGLLTLLASAPARAAYPVVATATVAGSGGGLDAANAIARDSSGNLYVAGSLTLAGMGDLWVAKFSSGLVMLSSYTYDYAGFSDAAFGVALDTSGGVYAAGYVSTAPAYSGRDIWLAKFDSNLVLQASVTVNGAGDNWDEAKGLRVSSGSVYAVGHSSTTSGKGQWVARYNSALVLQSSSTFVQFDAYGIDVLPAASGNVFVVGSRAINAATSVDAWIGKYDSSLVLVASRAVAGPAAQSDEYQRLIEDGTGGVFAVGYLYSATAADRYIDHFDSNLVRLSSSLVNGPGNSNEHYHDIVMTPSGNLLLAGDISDTAGAGSLNAYFAEYTTGLAFVSSTSYRSSGTGDDHANAIVLDASCNLYAAGWTTEATQDAWLGRFNAAPVSPPASPSGLAGTAQSTSTVLWSWTDNSSDETGFRLIISTTNVSGDLAANTTTWLQTGLGVNTSSGPIWVRVFNATGTADSSTLIRYSLTDPPNSISATFFGSSVALTWPTMTNTANTRWSVERGSDGVSYATQLYFSSGAAAFTDTGLAAATTYYYRVRSANTDGVYSFHANSSTSVYTGGFPAAASAFAGTAQSTSSILWSWTDNSSEEAGFRIKLGGVNLSGDLAVNATTWLQTGLSVNASSGPLLVQAFNSSGTADSGSLTRYSLAAVPASLAPSGVGLGAATLNWASGGNPGGTVYQLERSTGAGFGLRQSSGSLSFVDATLSPASTYYYRVRALNADLVASAYASTVTAVSAPLPVYPSVASIAPSSATVAASVPVAVVGAGFDASAVLTLERHAVDTGVWVATGSFTQARHSSTMMKLRDGRALLVGGLIEGQTAGRPEVDLYDLAAGAWTAASPLNVGRFQHADVMLADGRVFVTGGQAPDASVVASAEIYDPTSAVWTVVAPMSQVRKGHRMALLPDGRVLAVGGYTGAVSLLTAEIYDPLLNSWSAAASMSVVRAYPTLTPLGNGKVLVAGGRDPTLTTASAQVYDYLLNSWTATGAMSVSRSDHEALALSDGRVLVAGGLDAGGEASTADVYDPATSSWTATGLMGAARRSLALALVNGLPLAIGGQNAATDFASTDVYDAATNTWRAGPSLTNTRTIATAVALDDGRVLVAGGRRGLGGGTTLNTAERLGTASAVIAATGLSVPDAQHVNGAVSLTGAATGYWDVVVREPGGRVGRLNGGFQATPVIPLPAAPSSFGGSPQTTGSILWSWMDNASNELGYRVLYGSVSVSGDLAANTTFWLQTGLAANTSSWMLFAQAANSSGTANSGAASLYTLAGVPGTPAASGVYQTSATLNWSSNGNPAGTLFQLERSTGTGYGLQFAGAATSYFDQYLTPGATNVFRVRALNGDAVATAYSSSLAVVAVPPPATPGAAGTPVGAALGTSSATWTWVLASGATNHFLFRPSDNSYLGSSSSGPFIQTALTPNTAYGLKVAGVNLGGTGPLSPSATVYTLAAAPSAASVGTISSTSVFVSWGLNGNPAATVAQLERSTNAVVFAALAAGALTSYADADLIGCTTYYYRVRNMNGDGLATAYSSFTGVTANTTPGPPAGLTASANAGGTVSLNWSHSPTEGVTGYRLYWDAGTGTVNYGASIAVLTSTETAFTTGVLTSSASYTFALRAAHRCGLVETTGALAMSGAAAAPPPVRAVIKEPDSGRRINGNSITILGELISGAPSDVQQVLFQYKLAASTAWLDVGEANVNHENPDFSFPYFVHADVTLLAAGSYDLRAVAYDRNGVPDSAPPAVRVAVDPVAPDISETVTGDGKIKKDQTVSNAVTSTIETAGAGASDPAVRVSLPPGVVTAATATLSVIANPTITTAAPSGQTFVGSSIKIDLSNGQSALNGTAAITLTYPDTVRFPSLLQIFYLNEATGQWSRDFATAVDTASRTVTGLTPHFSTFALMLGTAFAADLNSVQVYPVPFKPNGPNADEGRPFTTGNANSGIIFSNLAMGAEIKIYTMTGRLVSSIGNPSIAGTVRWDARNQDGRDVASGAYFAVIAAGGHKAVVKKLVIIR